MILQSMQENHGMQNNFDSAFDKDGNAVDLEDVTVTENQPLIQQKQVLTKSLTNMEKYRKNHFNSES